MKVFKYLLVLVFITVMLQNCSSDKKSNTDNNFSNETKSKSEVSNSAQNSTEGSFSSLSKEELRKIKEAEARKKAENEKWAEANARRVKVLEGIWEYLYQGKIENIKNLSTDDFMDLMTRLNRVKVDGYQMSIWMQKFLLKNSKRDTYPRLALRVLSEFVYRPHIVSKYNYNQINTISYPGPIVISLKGSYLNKY